MKSNLANMDTNLGRAALAMVLAILIAFASSTVLGNLGYNPDVSAIVIFAAMPIIAWFLSRAAKTLGKNPFLYGAISLFPPFAFLCFMWLQQEDLRQKCDDSL